MRWLIALALSSFAAAASFEGISAAERARPLLPEPLDRNQEVFDRYWSWLLVETGAPADLPWPAMTVETLPTLVRMAFFFPTPSDPDRAMRIVLSPRSIARARGGEQLVVLGEVAHEIVHYVLLMQENDWAFDRPFFENAVHHHCDAEFQRLVAHVGSVLWSAYHSRDTIRAIDHMVQFACWRDGHRLGQSR